MRDAAASWNMEEASVPAGHRLRMLPVLMLLVGVAALGGAVALGGRERLFFAYHVAFLFWLSIGLGALFFVLLHHATKAGWSVVVRRLAEAWMSSLVVLVVLFVPVLLGSHTLFAWAHPGAAAHDHLLQHKMAYLNDTFFLVRAVVYFAVWVGLAWFYGSRSLRQDDSGEESISVTLRTLSYPALIVFALTFTFAGFDWVMSLTAEWYSTVFGVYLFAGSVVAIHSVLSLTVVLLRALGFVRKAVSPEHMHDLGKMMFAFTVFWAYIAFSQYMLIWYANIPEETFWFANRWQGNWRHATVALALGHFAVPFFYLILRDVKRHPVTLSAAALWMLLMQLFDIYWLVMPSLQKTDFRLSWIDAAAVVGVGGVVMAYVGWRLCRHPLVPLKDPRLGESLTFENM